MDPVVRGHRWGSGQRRRDDSHAIFVSRELGIPCVVSVIDATKRITDGSMIEVNGDAGTVTML